MRSLLFSIKQSLPAFRRIRQRSEFERAMNAGRIVENRWFRVYLCESAGCIARLGLVTSKKIIPAATARNFTKRLIRETFRREFLGKNALDVIVRAKRTLSPATSEEGRRALAQLLRAGLA